MTGALKLQEWTMQEWTSTEEVSGVDFAGVDNDGGKAQEVDNDAVNFTELS